MIIFNTEFTINFVAMLSMLFTVNVATVFYLSFSLILTLNKFISDKFQAKILPLQASLCAINRKYSTFHRSLNINSCVSVFNDFLVSYNVNTLLNITFNLHLIYNKFGKLLYFIFVVFNHYFMVFYSLFYISFYSPFVLVIIINFILYPYMGASNIMDLNVYYFIIGFYTWIRDLNREISFSSLFMSYFFLIISEWILFISIIWSYFNLSFGVFPLEALILSYLSSYGSIILSLGSLFGGYLFITYLILIYSLLSFLYLLIIILFLKIQTSEFRFLGLSFSDSILSSIFFYLTSLHLFHIIFAILFLLFLELSFIPIYLYFGSYEFHILNCVFIPPRLIKIATGNIYYWFNYFGISLYFGEGNIAFISILLYFHFVEMLWLLIDFVLYWIIVRKSIKLVLLHLGLMIEL